MLYNCLTSYAFWNFYNWNPACVCLSQVREKWHWNSAVIAFVMVLMISICPSKITSTSEGLKLHCKLSCFTSFLLGKQPSPCHCSSCNWQFSVLQCDSLQLIACKNSFLWSFIPYEVDDTVDFHMSRKIVLYLWLYCNWDAFRVSSLKIVFCFFWSIKIDLQHPLVESFSSLILSMIKVVFIGLE